MSKIYPMKDFREATPDIEVFVLNALKDSFADWLEGVSRVDQDDDDYDE